MQKYFISKDKLIECIIDTDDAFHISTVMRSKIGDEILVSDEEKCVLAKITSIAKDKVTFEVLKELEANNELPVKVTISSSLSPFGYP